MSLRSDWIEGAIKPRLLEARQNLAQFESGRVHSGKRENGGPWRDTTKEDTDRFRAEVAIYERLIADHEASGA